MCITVTLAQSIPDDVFARIVALTNLLSETDTNFEGLPIEVARGAVANVTVNDSEDKMRERLLRLLVEDALKSDADSMTGLLC